MVKKTHVYIQTHVIIIEIFLFYEFYISEYFGDFRNNLNFKTGMVSITFVLFKNIYIISGQRKEIPKVL